MSPDLFARKYLVMIDPSWRADFAADLEALAAHEQARERRRLCSDESYRRRAVETTKDEMQRFKAEQANGRRR